MTCKKARTYVNSDLAAAAAVRVTRRRERYIRIYYCTDHAGYHLTKRLRRDQIGSVAKQL